jgi:hypothetical protein
VGRLMARVAQQGLVQPVDADAFPSDLEEKCTDLRESIGVLRWMFCLIDQELIGAFELGQKFLISCQRGRSLFAAVLQLQAGVERVQGVGVGRIHLQRVAQPLFGLDRVLLQIQPSEVQEQRGRVG